MLVSNFPLLPHDQKLNDFAAPTSPGPDLGGIDAPWPRTYLALNARIGIGLTIARKY